MGRLASASTPEPPTPVSRSQLSIQKPPTALESSDEARTDTSSSPFMYLAHKPSDVKGGPTNEPTTIVTTPSTSSTSGRRRKADASSENKPAPKQRKYERKTKRFIWPDDLHRLFVAAIFDVGLKHASPKALLALMDAAGPNSGLTTEHLKSHLQKYRLNYERSRMEFLSYYDQSAKRNLKRRRRQTHNRANKAGSDPNTMFVFPISNPKRRKGRRSDDSDSNDSDSDTGDSKANDSNIQVDATQQDKLPRSRGSPASGTEAHIRSQGYTQLLQSPQQQPARNHLPSLPNGRAINGASATMLTDLVPIASHHFPLPYAQAQRKHPLDNLAVAAETNRYPLGQLLVPVTGGVSGMPELSDPQWSILNSLMSPQLAGMIGPEPEGATSEALTRGGGSADGFVLNEESIDLQMQMHLAMQAQMNLHRQMLTRKVEVAQHLVSHSSLETTDNSSLSDNRGNMQVPSRSFNESLGSAQQLGHHSFQQQQSQAESHQDPLALICRPSLSLSVSDSVPPSSVETDAIVTTPAMSEGMSISTSTVAASGATGSATESKGVDDGMDLYRWDRIDLNVELDDDDLFGFLKS